MKTKYHFEIMELEDDMVAVPISGNEGQFHGVLKINETAAEILKMLEKDTTEMQIVEDLMQQYSGKEEEIKKYVHEYIETLINEGVVEKD